MILSPASLLGFTGFQIANHSVCVHGCYFYQQSVYLPSSKNFHHGIRKNWLEKKGEDGDKTRRIIDCKSVDNSNQFSQFASIYLRNPKYRTVTAALCVRTAFEKLYELYFLLTISSTMVLLRRSSDSNLQLHRSGTN